MSQVTDMNHHSFGWHCQASIHGVTEHVKKKICSPIFFACLVARVCLPQLATRPL